MTIFYTMKIYLNTMYVVKDVLTSINLLSTYFFTILNFVHYRFKYSEVLKEDKTIIELKRR